MKSLRALVTAAFVLLLHVGKALRSGKLELVQVIHRHGDRTPFFPFPINATAEEVRREWPIGFQQITNRGLDQTRELGQFIRKRYTGFLPEKYDWNDILAVSSPVEYAIRSANSVLRGLYPSQNIPVRTIPPPLNNIFLLEDKIANCPRFEVELAKFTQGSKSYQEMDKEFEQVKRELVNVLGNQTDLEHATEVFDYLAVLENSGKPLPSWVTPHMQKMKELSILYLLQRLTGSLELKRLSSGMLQTVVSAIEELNNNALQNGYTFGPARALQIFQEHATAHWRKLLAHGNRKLYLFSAHDFTLAPFMEILGIFNQINPPYAAAIFVEARREPNSNSNSTHPNDLTIEIFYRNTTEMEPFLLEIPGCTSPCRFERLKEVLAPVIPKDYDSECKLQN